MTDNAVGLQVYFDFITAILRFRWYPIGRLIKVYHARGPERGIFDE
jgi:hypothetical protein